MVETATLLVFVATSLALAVTPGPTMLLALTNGIAGGLRHAAWGIAGATLASLLLISSVAVGLDALLMASRTLFELLRLLGVGYLVWLGVKLWQTRPAVAALPLDEPVCARVKASSAFASAAQPARSTGLARGRRAFVRSAAVQLSNPKAVLFFSAFLPQFIDATRPTTGQYAELALVFVVLDLCVMLAYAAAGMRAVRLLSVRGLRVINRGCAGFMFVLAAALALFRRGTV